MRTLAPYPALVTLLACSFGAACSLSIPEDNAPCPCSAGWRCCSSLGICVREGTPCAAGPTEGLVALYPFDGNAADESGNDNHGVVDGAVPTADRFAQAASAYHFNGTPDHIEIPFSPAIDFAVSAQFSFGLWAYVDSLMPWEMVALAKSANSDHFAYSIAVSETGNPIARLLLGDAEIDCSPPDGIAIHTWHQLYLTADQTRVRLYVDGLEACGNSYGEVAWEPDTFPRATLVGMGGTAENPRQTFYGAIDDVRFYDRVLSESEIEEIFRERDWH